MKRSPLKRKTRMAPKGRRAERDADALAEFNAVVKARHWCERCGDRGRDAHHMRVNPRVHDAKLGALLCRICHSAVHDHTAEDWARWFR